MNLENKVDKNAISFDSGTVPNRGLIKYYYLPLFIKVQLLIDQEIILNLI